MSTSLSIISKFPSFLPSLFRGLDADPLYISELDTINSLLHHKKHVRGSSDIGFVVFVFA